MLQTAALLDVDNVSVSLGGRLVLRNVSFSLAPGAFCGLIGSNGSGKTTLLRSILGLTPPSSGHVTIANNGNAGYVPQKLELDSHMPLRARDLVELGLTGNRFGFSLPSKSRKAALDEMLAAVDATAFADQRIGNLSGGQQQRILIAHALIRRPQLLLLDEPLANLDIRAVAEILLLLRKLAREHNITVLISAHDMNPLMGVMDRVIYLAHGRAASGTPSEIIRTEVLSALYGYHIDVIRVHGRVLVIAACAPDEMPAVLDEHPAHVTAIP
jgi:zinc/manganese transport system ATP-binding protein